jgi:hypothetical protein
MSKCLTQIIQIILAIITISGCVFEPLETPQTRNFGTMDLLIDITKILDGWKVKTKPHTFSEIGALETATVSFVSNSNATRNNASIGIYNYYTVEEASRVYQRMFVPRVIGDPPLEWTSPEITADMYEIGCYDYESREPLSCEWTALYKEFIFQFNTWIIPNYMTFEDFEKIIVNLDNRISSYVE